MNAEGLVGVNDRATRTVSVITISGLALSGNVELALRVASGLRVSRDIEAVWVGLHHIDRLAIGLTVHGVLSAVSIVLDEVEACNTAAVHRAEVDIVGDRATADARHVGLTFFELLHRVLDEDAVVHRDLNGFLVRADTRRGEWLRLNVLGVGATVLLDLEVHPFGVCGGNCYRKYCKASHFCCKLSLI